MHRGLLSLIPVVGGALVMGIVVGYASHDTIVDRLFAPSADVRSVSYQDAASLHQEVRQQAQDEISNSRQNAITRTVALVRSTVVGITVTEVREYSDPWSRFLRRSVLPTVVPALPSTGAGVGFRLFDFERWLYPYERPRCRQRCENCRDHDQG